MAAPSASSAALQSVPSASVCERKSTESLMSLLLPDPRHDLVGNVVGRCVFYDASLALLLRKLDFCIGEAVGADLNRLGLLQRRHNGPHVCHADLRIVARFSEMSGGPAQN